MLKYSEDLQTVRAAGFARRLMRPVTARPCQPVAALPARGDLAEVAARFGDGAARRPGCRSGPGRCERFARAVTVARPGTPRALYLCALATLVSSQEHVETLERVFGEMFGGLADAAARWASWPPEVPLPGAGRQDPGGPAGQRGRARPASTRPTRPRGRTAEQTATEGDGDRPDADAETENRFLGQHRGAAGRARTSPS